MKVYSVELKGNGWNDDTFTSEKLLDCLIFTKENDYIIGVNARFALIDDEDGYCYGVSDEIRFIAVTSEEDFEKVEIAFNLCDCGMSGRYPAYHWYHDTDWEIDFYVKF